MAIVMAGEEVECGGRPTTDDQEEICTRTSWVDARTAISHINKGRASGSRSALWMRKFLQDRLQQLGEFSERHNGKILVMAFLIMAISCVGLGSATLVTDIEELWVEEGGRLERELNYVSQTLGKGSGTTNQLLIQTAEEGYSENVLTASSLLTHLRVLEEATKVNVDMYDISWSLNDLCFATSFPYFEDHIIDQIFERLTPCAIITPLDCFWEGSKLLGPEFFVTIPGYGELVKWSNLNPQKIVTKMKQFQNFGNYFPFSAFSDFMKRAGITTAYQQKPCLNPKDPDCPTTAPNKQSSKPPDIGAELTGGCYGFAGKYLHWPEELIVGGMKKNRTGHIVKGEALQSIVQLMGSKDLFEHWQDHYKVHNMEWSQEKADIILSAWVTKFSKKVKEAREEFREETRQFQMQPFASSALGNLIRQFSSVSVPRVVIACFIMILYTCFSLVRLNQSNIHESSVGLGIAGVLLVIFSIASSLGLCAVIGLPFSAATTQILPFLALGLGVDNMFLMVHTVQELASGSRKAKLNRNLRVGEILKRCGISVILTSICSASGFFAAAIVPIPALRVLCIQAGLLVLSTSAAILIVFPAIISLDLLRRDGGRTDILCCIPISILNEKGMELPTRSKYNKQSDVKRTAVTRVLSPPGRGTVTKVLCAPSSSQECWVGTNTLQAPSPSLESLTADSTGDLVKINSKAKERSCESFFTCSLTTWLSDVYAVAITQGCAKACTMLCLLLTVAASAWGVSRLKDGLDLSDVIPIGTPEASFLSAQQKYFGFYNMFAVTQGNFEYPTKQKLVNEYHEAFNRIPWIIKNDNGGLPDSWLVLFRDWLQGLQRAFDIDWEKGFITEEGWERNASASGILAYKLLVQTGHVDHPVDRSLVSQVRLVNDEGIINPKAFYNYLTAWVSNDALAYSASQANLVPMPRFWYHERSDYDLKIPKSSPIVYAQFPFYLNHLDDTETITEMIERVRDICKKFEDKGLPNFPTGIPFTFWEQYINLRYFLLLALVVVLTTTFLVLSVMLLNVWAAALVVLILATLILQLAGILGLLGLKLSAAPAILLVISVGIGVESSVHVTIGFLTAIGDRNRRVRIAISHSAIPILNGAVSTFLASSMFLFSDFDFVKQYFFLMMTALVFLGALDGLLFLPVLFSLVGPPADLISRTSSDRVPEPSPPPSPASPIHQSYSNNSSRRTSHKVPHNPVHSLQQHTRRPYPSHHGSNLSLTTISEEPASNSSSSSSHRSSHEILVEPQVVVETTTCNGSYKHVGGKDSSEGIIYHEGPHVTTTVTATAKVKVELHNKPISGLQEVHSAGNQNYSTKCSNNRCSNNSSPTNISVSSNRSGRCTSSSTSSSSSSSSCTSSSCSDKNRRRELDSEERYPL